MLKISVSLNPAWRGRLFTGYGGPSAAAGEVGALPNNSAYDDRSSGDRRTRVAGVGCSSPKPLRAANLAEQSQMGGCYPHPQPPEMSAVPFKANADRRHHIPKSQTSGKCVSR